MKDEKLVMKHDREYFEAKLAAYLKELEEEK
jgi:hypothetical protein